MHRLSAGLTALTLIAAACAPQAPAQQPAAGNQPAQQAPAQPAAVASSYARPELLVETDWLAKNMSDASLRIVDLRAADKYQAGHIPGAVNLNQNDLDQKYGEVQNVAAPDKVAKVLGDLGIGNDSKVVLYDDNKTLIAGRVFWVLDYHGHTKTAILNGGYPKWEAENREATRQAPRVQPVTFKATPDASKIADAAYVKANLGNTAVSLCDVRTPEEYAGTDVRAARGGAIPGSKNVNWETNLTSGNTAVMKLAEQLKELYTAAGVKPENEIVTYCQTGVRAAQAYFTLKLLGYQKVRNYDGSWHDWAADASLPIEKKG